MNSRMKGKRGELEVAKVIRQHFGVEVHRTAQVDGKMAADLTGWDGVHIEVKRPARCAAVRYLEQAERDCGGKSVPVVFVKPDKQETFVMVRAADMVEFARRVLDGAG
jgi:hypothetical protein